MKHKIFYQNGGAIDINDIIAKLNNNKLNFDSLFGENNWAFTGSSAVAIYAHFFRPDLLSQLPQPNDIDILVQEERGKPITARKIGSFDVRKQETLERSLTFTNSITGESLDLTTIPNLKFTEVLGLPLYNIKNLINEYSDELSGGRENDDIKLFVLQEVEKMIPKEEKEPLTKMEGMGETSRKLF